MLNNECPFEFQTAYIHTCCIECPNHPINGGNGICRCSLPDSEGKDIIKYYYVLRTMKTGDKYMIPLWNMGR